MIAQSVKEVVQVKESVQMALYNKFSQNALQFDCSLLIQRENDYATYGHTGALIFLNTLCAPAAPGAAGPLKDSTAVKLFVKRVVLLACMPHFYLKVDADS